jgi:hypothetical protein
VLGIEGKYQKKKKKLQCKLRNMNEKLARRYGMTLIR